MLTVARSADESKPVQIGVSIHVSIQSITRAKKTSSARGLLVAGQQAAISSPMEDGDDDNGVDEDDGERQRFPDPLAPGNEDDNEIRGNDC